MLPVTNLTTLNPAPVIHFEREGENRLQAYIETEHLDIHSVTKDGQDDFTTLVRNEKNLKNFRNEKRWEWNEINQRYPGWVKRWEDNNPFSAFSIQDREATTDDKRYAGWVVLGGGDALGQSELAGIGVAGRGYGARGLALEATSAIVNYYAPELTDPNSKVKKPVEGGFYKLNGHAFKSIAATSRTDNQSTCSMLQNVGFQSTEQKEKWGHKRHVFSAQVTELDRRGVDPTRLI